MSEPLTLSPLKIAFVWLTLVLGLGTYASRRTIAELFGSLLATEHLFSQEKSTSIDSADLRGVQFIAETGNALVGLKVYVGTIATPYDDSDRDGVILIPASFNGQLASIRLADGTELLQFRLQLAPDKPQKVVVALR